jgi:hypothetical protein
MANKYFQSQIDDSKLFTKPTEITVKSEAKVTVNPFADLQERSQLLDSIRNAIRSKKDPNQKLISVGSKTSETVVPEDPQKIIQEMFK